MARFDLQLLDNPILPEDGVQQLFGDVLGLCDTFSGVQCVRPDASGCHMACTLRKASKGRPPTHKLLATSMPPPPPATKSTNGDSDGWCWIVSEYESAHYSYCSQFLIFSKNPFHPFLPCRLWSGGGPYAPEHLVHSHFLGAKIWKQNGGCGKGTVTCSVHDDNGSCWPIMTHHFL